MRFVRTWSLDALWLGYHGWVSSPFILFNSIHLAGNTNEWYNSPCTECIEHTLSRLWYLRTTLQRNYHMLFQCYGRPFHLWRFVFFYRTHTQNIIHNNFTTNGMKKKFSSLLAEEKITKITSFIWIMWISLARLNQKKIIVGIVFETEMINITRPPA